MTESTDARSGGIREQLSTRLGGELRNLVDAAGERFVSAATDRIGSTTDRLVEYAQASGPTEMAALTGVQKVAEGQSPVKAGLSAGLTAGKAKLKAALRVKVKVKVKVTNIVESIDVGVPVQVAYNQWTQFEDFPRFMKKVEHVEQESDEKLIWKAHVFSSHRTWESTVIEQVPDQRIVWRSNSDKGSVDGTVTFHEIAPNLTRILLVLEHHPQGLFERAGNIWRAEGRRARLELKHYARHVMTQAILRPDEVEGWRGEIRDGRVVRPHEPATAQDADQRPRKARKASGDRENSKDQSSSPNGRQRPGGARRRPQQGERK